MNGDFGLALAFATGIFGAFHCLGMCAGVNAGFFASLGRAPRAVDLLLFHATRIGFYLLLGVGGAVFGRVIAQSGIVGKTQGLLMMLAGVLIMLLGARLAGLFARQGTRRVGKNAVPLSSLLEGSKAKRLPVLAGLFNGLVPCSLVFSVAIQAAATADPFRAGLLMLAFGAGTLPAMAGLSLLAAVVGYRVQGVSARMTGVLIMGLGLWTWYQGWVMYDVLRGLANW